VNGSVSKGDSDDGADSDGDSTSGRIRVALFRVRRSEPRVRGSSNEGSELCSGKERRDRGRPRGREGEERRAHEISLESLNRTRPSIEPKDLVRHVDNFENE